MGILMRVRGVIILISEEIKGPGKLYSEEGAVNLGWSRHPQLDLNIEKARFMKIKAFQKFRTKRWDYYYVFAEKFFFSVTLADLGYIGTSFIYFYDYEKNAVTEDMIIIPLASGFQMVRNSDKGRTCFENKKIKVVFDVDESGRSINLEFPSFNKGEGVEAHFKKMLFLNDDTVSEEARAALPSCSPLDNRSELS
jgi:hypothetical protein